MQADIKLIVFDLEWNMANPWDKIDPEKKRDMPYEIIEIGAVCLNLAGIEEKRFSVKIKPVLYRKLNRHVGQVTARSQASLNSGYSFRDAAQAFFRFCGESYYLCSWSESDSEPLRRNLMFHGMSGDLGVRVLDVQRAFTALAEPGQPQRNVEYALDYLQLEKNLPFHTALTDARYTGRVLEKLLRFAAEEGMSQETFIKKFSYNPDIQLNANQPIAAADSFEAARAALPNEVCVCPACGAELSLEDDWTTQGRIEVAQYRCAKHGEVSVHCRLRKDSRNGKIMGMLRLRIINR